MEPKCSQCNTPRFLQKSEAWKANRKSVTAGLVCVWCGHIERGVFLIQGTLGKFQER